MSAEEWNRAEARRAANRLGDQWKKNPWLSGSTIDLDEHEYAFRDALGGVDADALPPAVLDWLRWRYRRTQIDQQNAATWHKALTQDLPLRVTNAGPRPAADCGRDAKPETKPRTWKVHHGQGIPHSKRALPDKPKAAQVQRGKGYGRRGRPRTQPAGENEQAELSRVYRENAAVLEPIMAAVQDEAKQMAVLRTLREYLAKPADAEACKRWLSLVATAQT